MRTRAVPSPQRSHLYQALYLFNRNRGFEITLVGLKRLEELGVFRQENLSDYEVRLSATRALANEELTSVMQGYEEDDVTYWDNRFREDEKARYDPDDVFFDVRAARRSKSRSRSCSQGWRESVPNDQAPSASGGSANVRNRNQPLKNKSHRGGAPHRAQMLARWGELFRSLDHQMS